MSAIPLEHEIEYPVSVPEGERLRLVDSATGKPLLRTDELETARAEAETARAKAETALVEERAARQKLEERLRELEKS